MEIQNENFKPEVESPKNWVPRASMIRQMSLMVGACVCFSALLAHPASAASSVYNQTDSNAGSVTNAARPHDFVNGLVNLEFSDHHLTPRGINLQDKGLIFQPYARLDWVLYDGKSPATQTLDKITFTTAVWNDFDTTRSGVDSGHWNEIDFIAGPNVTIFQNWAVESPFIGFKSETGSFPMCYAWNPKLTYHDHLWKHFSINPYAEFFIELKNKITVVLAPETSKLGYYGVLGMTPTYTFDQLPLKLELPTYMLIPGENFYQRANGSGGGTDVGLFTTTFKATVPLNFIDKNFGKWSLYAGVQYFYLNNPGLLDGNELAGAGHSRERDIVVLHAGMTVRF